LFIEFQFTLKCLKKLQRMIQFCQRPGAKSCLYITTSVYELGNWPSLCCGQAVTNLHFFRAPAALSSRNRLISAECWCTLTARAIITLLWCCCQLESVLFFITMDWAVCVHSLHSLSRTQSAVSVSDGVVFESQETGRDHWHLTEYVPHATLCAERAASTMDHRNSPSGKIFPSSRWTALWQDYLPSPACSFTKLPSTEKSKMIFVSNVSALDALKKQNYFYSRSTV
jgi:hypothetical protein